MTIGDAAIERFQGGFSCSESVLLALSERMGIENEMIPRIATGFGSGMGRCGFVCGAFSGAVMSLGLRFGRTTPQDDREKLYGLVRDLEGRFRERFGDTDCIKLIGYDMRTPEGLAAAKAAGVFRSKCDLFVRAAAEWAAEMAGTQ